MGLKTSLVREPVYEQLNGILRDLLVSGNFRPGDKFLTEREVSAQFGVSRATANKALANLVSERLIEFRKGVGTFVRRSVLDYDLRSLISFTGKAIAAGKKPSTKVVVFRELSTQRAGLDVEAALQAEPATRLIYMERVRLADAIPAILEKRYLIASFCPGIKKADLNGSIYELWRERFGLDIQGEEQVIRAVAIEGSDAERLQVPAGSAGLLVTGTGVLRDGRPLWWEQTLYRGDAYEFHNRLGGVRSAVGRLR